MKPFEETTKTIDYLNRLYRYTFYNGPNIIKIEVSEPKENWMGKIRYKWRTIYMGHINPIEQAIKFFNDQTP